MANPKTRFLLMTNAEKLELQDLASDLIDMGFDVTFNRSAAGITCTADLEGSTGNPVASATGDTQLEAMQAVHKLFYPDGVEAAGLEARALLDGLGT